VVSYARGDIGQEFATTYRLPTPKHAPFAIGYAFEGKPHDYLHDVVGTHRSGKLFIAEAGMEDDKRVDRNLAKAEAARRLARLQLGTPGLICSACASSTRLEIVQDAAPAGGPGTSPSCSSILKRSK
jgi:hypothetical protein